MRIAGNKVKHLISFFHDELKGLYSKEEINELAFRVFEFYLKFNREDMVSRAEENLNQSELLLIYDAVKDLAKAKPLQYVIGEAYFYKYKFYVNDSVLIPRPETEELVEIIYRDNKDISGTIIDLGTGSACIPVALKCLLPNTNIEACDVSDKALVVAQKNADLNKVMIKLFKADILDPNLKLNTTYDIIISNPPYIKRSEAKLMHDNVAKFEPHLALFVEGGDDIVFYRKIISLCRNYLKPNGKLYFELNPLTADHVVEFAEGQNIFSRVELLKDLSGNTRFFKAIK